ncbi:MAG: class I SAM-dependent methyltransferase [Vicinamibacteraceae bacterium]
MLTKRQVATYTELRHWYDEQYRAQGTWRTSADYAEALVQLLDRAGVDRLQDRRLLDVACGGAHFAEFCRDRFRGVAACDLSRVALGEAKAREPWLRLCQANAELLPFADGAFDIVACLGSLEHMLDVRGALRELARVLRPGGWSLILVPTHPNWVQYDVQPTEVVMDAPEWSALLDACGLPVRASLSTDECEALRASSWGCEVFASTRDVARGASYSA